MRKFAFNLQTVLDYRETIEEMRLREFGAAQRAVLEQNRAIRDLLDREEQAKADLREMEQATLNVTQIRLQMSYLASLNRKIQLAYQELQRRLIEEADKRNDLIEARKDRRAMELLKEKRRKAWELELRREEQKQFDEIASSRHRREPA